MDCNLTLIGARQFDIRELFWLKYNFNEKIIKIKNMSIDARNFFINHFEKEKVLNYHNNNIIENIIKYFGGYDDHYNVWCINYDFNDIKLIDFMLFVINLDNLDTNQINNKGN